MRSVLTCLLCPEAQAPLAPSSNLLAYQEHLLNQHGVSRDDLAQAQRWHAEGGVVIVYEWGLPDGRPWLRAETLTGLVQAGMATGYPPEQLAEALNISRDILAKLEARALLGESLPSSLVRSIAEVTKVALPLVEAYLEAPPAASPFRCGPGSQQPLGKEPFWKSVSQSPRMSAAQKAAWLAVVEAEGKR